MNNLKYFGLATVTVEWLGVFVASMYIDNFNFDNAISVLSVAPYPLSLIYSLTITLAGIFFFLYTISLREYSKYIPALASIASLTFIALAWVPLRGDGSITDAIHGIFGVVSAIAYTFIIWECRKHPKNNIASMSVKVSVILLVLMLASVLSSYVFYKYYAVIEILIVVVMQYWIISLTWHSSRD